MIYIIVALSIEAKPLIHHYKLQKEEGFFCNKEILLCISQVGFNNALTATQKLFSYKKPQKEDILLNIGLCGAPLEYKIGSLLIIDTLLYQSQVQKLSLHVNHSFQTSSLTTVDTVQSNSYKTAVDMEAFAIFHTVSKFIAIEKMFFIKIVSDHFQPHTLDKNLAYGLINKQIKNITSFISTLQRNQQCQQQ